MSINLKKRFCKDYNLPVKLFDDPYFMERLQLCSYEGIDAVNLFNEFCQEIKVFPTEQDYFTYYNKLKDDIINHIKSKQRYQDFISNDFTCFQVNNQGIGENTVFRAMNDGKKLLSLDLIKGNFTAFKFFHSDMVDNMETYEQFISQFTQYKHIINSKYIRQVVFGNCNPKRQVGIEKYIMSNFFKICYELYPQNILSFSSDEVVMDITNISNNALEDMMLVIKNKEEKLNVKLHKETYVMTMIPNSEFCIQNFSNGNKKLKNVPALFYPFVVKYLTNQPVTENDKVFYHEGYLSTFINYPKFI